MQEVPGKEVPARCGLIYVRTHACCVRPGKQGRAPSLGRRSSVAGAETACAREPGETLGPGYGDGLLIDTVVPVTGLGEHGFEESGLSGGAEG